SAGVRRFLNRKTRIIGYEGRVPPPALVTATSKREVTHDSTQVRQGRRGRRRVRRARRGGRVPGRRRVGAVLQLRDGGKGQAGGPERPPARTLRRAEP